MRKWPEGTTVTSFSKTSELSDWQHIPGDPAVGVPDRYVAYYEDIPGGESYMLVVSPATSADAEVIGEAGAWYWSVEKGQFGILVLDGLTDTMDAAKRKAESVARNESSGFYSSKTANVEEVLEQARSRMQSRPDLIAQADDAYERQDQGWFDAQSLDDLIFLWEVNPMGMIASWDDEVFEALNAKGYFGQRTAADYSFRPGTDLYDEFGLDWGYDIDLDGEGGPTDYFEMGEGDLTVFIFDPDNNDEIVDSVGGVQVNYQVSDHGNIIPDAAGEAYLLEVARELAQEYTGRTASKVANELVGYPGDDMEDEEMPEVEEIPIAGMARRNPILPAQGRVTDWRNRSNR